MIILGIETSCDETAIAIIEVAKNPREEEKVGITVLADITRSQAKLHEKFGGVFPNLANREHQKNLVPVLRAILSEASFLNSLPSNKPEINKPHSDVLENIRMGLTKEPELLGEFLEFARTAEKPGIDIIAVTEGPGLEPCLWVGLNFAKALSRLWNVPILPVDHMEGHILVSLLKRNEESNKSQSPNSKPRCQSPPKADSVRGRQFSISKKNPVPKQSDLEPRSYNLEAIPFPALALLISGGHTELVLMQHWFQYEIIGRTRDDAVGEAFDKVARILGLPYPGGPPLSALAERARTDADFTRTDAGKMQKGSIPRESASSRLESAVSLPRPMIRSDTLDFSFSGLKTAVLYLVRKLTRTDEVSVREGLRPVRVSPRLQSLIAREFENAVTEALTEKTRRAIDLHGAKTLILGGGVVANTHIRQAFEELAKEKEVKLFIPAVKQSTDNALMIALAGGLRLLLKNGSIETSLDTLSAKGNKRLDEK